MTAVARAMNKFRLAVVQLQVSGVKAENLSRARSRVKEAAENGSQLVLLPECFNSPYGTGFFPKYAEKIPGESSGVLSEAAREHRVYVVGGSIPEEEDGKLYNTCAVFGPDGEMILKHRKIHLFDIDVPGKICFQESETLSPGKCLSMFDTPFCKVGVGICYDIRFAELAQLYTRKGCQLLLYPGAFNMTTGPAHWEILQRGRALDNQVYVATASPARDDTASYVAWGHSTVVSPWGDVVSKAGPEETILYADIAISAPGKPPSMVHFADSSGSFLVWDRSRSLVFPRARRRDLQYLADIRQQIPVTSQRRDDLYSVTCAEETSNVT